KPVPHVGWVFMERVPVRGPASRRSVSEARKAIEATTKASKRPKAKKAAKASKAAKAAEASTAAAATDPGTPKRRRAHEGPSGDGVTGATPPASPDTTAVGTSDDGIGEPTTNRAAKDVSPYNEALPFIEFIADHPVGSEVEATVERFSSHGAYVLAGDARGYVPLRNLARPAPRSAREVLNLGDRRRFVVIAIDAPRRGIDLALPGVVAVPAGPEAPVEEQVVEALGIPETPAPAKATARKTKAAAGAKRAATKKAAAKTSPAPKRAPKKAPAKATVATTSPAATSPAKARARKPAATTGAAKRAPARRVTGAKATKQDGAKRAAKKAPDKKAPAKRTAAKKAPRQ
ncbi:MAG TPA: S1 RNA-binding domain-containing protein, partial [Acidimicrobiales bacterium]|nr:S1 RNA-binding domain-containing protein [Acidimicrobiales bacterium]